MSRSLQAGVCGAKTPLEVLGGQGLLPEPGAAVKSSDGGPRVTAPVIYGWPFVLCVCVLAWLPLLLSTRRPGAVSAVQKHF